MVVTWLIFTVYIVATQGVLPSYSNSHYALKGRKKALFVLWAVVLGACMMYLTYGSLTGFLAGLGMWIVATVPAYKIEMGKQIHYIGAFMSFGASYLWMYFYDHWILATVSLALIVVIILPEERSENWMWWLEFIAFITMFLAIACKVWTLV